MRSAASPKPRTAAWTYHLNGQYINASCSSTVVHAGDSIQWIYVLVN